MGFFSFKRNNSVNRITSNCITSIEVTGGTKVTNQSTNDSYNVFVSSGPSTLSLDKTTNYTPSKDSRVIRSSEYRAVECFMVGGGGGCNQAYAGGGGAGGIVVGNRVLPSSSYPVSIGVGGEARTSPADAAPSVGGDTTFDGLTAAGGGAGIQDAYEGPGSNIPYLAGGSSGGLGDDPSPVVNSATQPTLNPGEVISQFGNPGFRPISLSAPGPTNNNGGGGGAGTGGPITTQYGSGGDGFAFPYYSAPIISSAIPAPVQPTWTPAVGPTGLYGGGGAGGGPTGTHNPGPGGGGTNGGGAGVTNTGGGGGGGNAALGGVGGTGILIVRSNTRVRSLGTKENPARSGVALYNAGFRESGLYYISTSNGGVKQVYVDLETVDATTNTAGWMLVGSWTNAAEWTKQAATSDGVFDRTVRDCFSSNFGDTLTNFFRVHVSDNIKFTKSNSVADFYFYRSSGTSWKRWWTSDGTSPYNSSTTNSGTSVARNSLIQFTHAYNLKYSYTASTQVWNNLSDNNGVQGNWDTGLTTTATSIGFYNQSDGSLAIIPSGETDTGAGQDCNRNNAKFGYDDTTAVYGAGTTSTENVGQSAQTSGANQKLWMWIK
jgi:hypothetical protein